MKQHKARDFRILNWICIFVFILLTGALAAGALSVPRKTVPFAEPAQPLSGFSYEIADGESGAAAFPHSFKNLSPNTAVTVNAAIDPAKHESLLVKTVYTQLKLYALDHMGGETLIYACGQPGDYPSWMLDPPTLLQIVPVPENAVSLRFEYSSPSQRSTMSLPVLMAGNEGMLLYWLFGQNAAILTISVFLLIIGITLFAVSLFSRRDNEVFLQLGLFALAVGCWSFGECNATAFILPNPVLLYLMAFIGLFTFTIPLFRYGLLILNPKNSLPLQIAVYVTMTAVILALGLQLAGLVSLSKSMYFFHILLPLEILLFAVITVYEYLRHKNLAAKQFIVPILVMTAATILEVVNYSLHFTRILSLFVLLGALAFTLMLGFIGIRHTAQIRRSYEAAVDEIAFYRRMSHELRTPLTKISTNIQIVNRQQTIDHERLNKSQDEIMRMAEIIDEALNDRKESGADE